MYFGLLTSLVSATDQTKCVSLGSQKCMTQPSFINLHPNKYNQELRYYPFAVNLDRCAGSYSWWFFVEYVFQMKQDIQTCMFLIW